MAARSDLPSARDAVAERRERVMELTRRGWYAWQIAFEMGITERTVQRYRDHERTGRPAGRPKMYAETLEKMKPVAEMLAAGYSGRAISRALNVNKHTVWRYARYIRSQP